MVWDFYDVRSLTYKGWLILCNQHSDKVRNYSKWPPTCNRASYAKTEKKLFILSPMSNDWHWFEHSRMYGLWLIEADYFVVPKTVFCPPSWIKMADWRHFGKNSWAFPQCNCVPNLKFLVRTMPKLLRFEKCDGQRRRRRRRRQTEYPTTIWDFVLTHKIS